MACPNRTFGLTVEQLLFFCIMICEPVYFFGIFLYVFFFGSCIVCVFSVLRFTASEHSIDILNFLHNGFRLRFIANRWRMFSISYYFRNSLVLTTADSRPPSWNRITD